MFELIKFRLRIEEAIKRADRYLKAKEVSMEWQPIETAPKDGTHCWLYETETDKQWRGYFSDGKWICGASSNDHTVAWMMVINPAHWMPLPDPPKSA